MIKLLKKWEDFLKTWIEEGNQVLDYLQKEFDLAQNNLSAINENNVDERLQNEDTNSIGSCSNSWVDEIDALVEMRKVNSEVVDPIDASIQADANYY